MPPLVALEVEAKVNSVDGCADCGCRAQGALERDSGESWWIAFGLIQSYGLEDWSAAGASSYCGTGSFETIVSAFTQTVGNPYVILNGVTSAGVDEGNLFLETKLRIQKLSGFDQSGQPAYERSTQKRMLHLGDRGDMTVPLLIADERERQAFGVHEVLVHLGAQILERETAAEFGVVSVSADVPGALVLLDGGLVGRIAEGKPILIENVYAGTREVGVRDFSGREVRRAVVVNKNQTVDVAVKVLQPATDPETGLISIGKNPQGHEEYWRVQDAAMVVKVPAGEFLMGSPEGEGNTNERPQHLVYLSEFLLDKTEVTWRQFRKYAEARGVTVPGAPVWGTADDYPVSFMDWEEAKGYCEWVGGRLPTEAEWEKAARGTDGRQYPWGDKWDPGRCNSISGGLHRPESVGSYPNCLSPYGVLDMLGSKWEWTADWYGADYYAESPYRDPKGPTSGTVRARRGGGWMSQPTWLRTAHRFTASANARNADHGFRCAQDPPE